MNIFRLAGDSTHVIAIIILLLRIIKTRSCSGISGKTQIMFLVVYMTRYLDLLTTYVSLYNSVVKMLFLATSAITVYFIYVQHKKTYDRYNDSFRIELILIPCAVLALILNHEFTLTEVLWTFSIYLEAVAIMPQVFFVNNSGETQLFMIHYLIAFGSYRALYLVNWVYRFFVESHYDLIAIFAGIVQTLIFVFTFFLIRGENIVVTDTEKAIPSLKKEGPLNAEWVPPAGTGIGQGIAVNISAEPAKVHRPVKGVECAEKQHMDPIEEASTGIISPAIPATLESPVEKS